jgi:predicted RecA/RadA family phage recombinase
MAKYANAAHTPLDPGHNFTATASGAVKGGYFVQFAAGGRPGLPTAALSTATSGSIGVAKYDAASGETFGVISGGHVGVVAAGAIAEGAPVYISAAGKATATAGSSPRVGYAYTASAADLDVVYIQLDL